MTIGIVRDFDDVGLTLVWAWFDSDLLSVWFSWIWVCFGVVLVWLGSALIRVCFDLRLFGSVFV